ncbi:hypothetical protein IAT38_005353 [Cryptococcus sp. DSM 104549]
MDLLLLLAPHKCLFLSRRHHLRATRVLYRHLTMTDHIFFELCFSSRRRACNSLTAALAHTRTLRIVPAYREEDEYGYSLPPGSPRLFVTDDPHPVLFPGVTRLEFWWDDTPDSRRRILRQPKLNMLYYHLGINCPARNELVFYLECELIGWTGPRRMEVMEHLHRGRAKVITWVLWPKLPLPGEAEDDETGFYNAPLPSLPLDAKTQMQRVVYDARFALHHPHRPRFVPPVEEEPSSVWEMVKDAVWKRGGGESLKQGSEEVGGASGKQGALGDPLDAVVNGVWQHLNGGKADYACSSEAAKLYMVQSHTEFEYHVKEADKVEAKVWEMVRDRLVEGTDDDGVLTRFPGERCTFVELVEDDFRS